MLAAAALSLSAQTGTLTIHMILHAVGEEHYEISSANGQVTLNTVNEYTDRANKRTTAAMLRMKPDFTPLDLEIKGRGTSIHLDGSAATVTEDAATRTFEAPAKYFAIFGPSPFAVQMMMLRYWNAHGRPAELPMLRANPAAEPIRIERVGRDTIQVDGKPVTLERYTIANLMFGHEILWMNASGDLAAAMTFAGGLPMEAVRSEYEAGAPRVVSRRRCAGDGGSGFDRAAGSAGAQRGLRDRRREVDRRDGRRSGRRFGCDRPRRPHRGGGRAFRRGDSAGYASDRWRGPHAASRIVGDAHPLLRSRVRTGAARGRDHHRARLRRRI